MDKLTLLRTLRNDVAEPGAEQLAPSLDKLERAFHSTHAQSPAQEAAVISTSAAHTNSSAARRRFGFAGISVAAAFALVGVLVASNVLGLGGWRGGADPAAAAILERAATAALTFSDAPLSEGQYLRVSSQNVHITDGQENNGPIITYRINESSQLYVPADRTDDWVWVRNPIQLVDVLTPGGEAFAERRHPTTTADTLSQLLRAPDGAFYGSSKDSTWGSFDDMPRDPYLLLNYIYRVTLGAGPSPDGEALVFIADTLRQGTAPADLRAALLRAATMIPGVTITDNEATLDGSTGTAIGRVETNNAKRVEIIIDPTSGRLIGEREVAVVDIPESDVVAGDILSWSSVETAVVDAAPAGGTPDGVTCVFDPRPESFGCATAGSN
ncbi:MAG: CU044_5270 family protein [Rhodoglobus sp.]